MFQRFSAVAVVALCSLGLTAFQQASQGYVIDFPSGWSPSESGDPNLTSYAAADGTTNCNAQSVRIPALDEMTQAQINAEQTTPYDAASWANFIGVDPSFITVHDAEVRNRGDYHFQVATLTILPGAMDNTVPVMVRMGAIVLVGRVVTAGCYAQPKTFPQVEAEFDHTIGSLRPR